MPEPARKGAGEALITVGVDTHLDEHVTVAIDQLRSVAAWAPCR